MIKELPKSNGSVLGFEITGKVTMEQETEWLSRFDQITKKHKKINVLLVLEENTNWESDAGIEDLKWLMKHMSQFNKIAAVIDKNIGKWFITIGSVLAKMLGIGSILNRRGYK